MKSIDIDNESIDLELIDPQDLSIRVVNGGLLNLKIANFEAKDTINISAEVGLNSTLNIVCADFSNSDITINSNVDLILEHASCNWKLATLAKEHQKKLFNISFNHLVRHTNAEMNNYGVSVDEANIVFTGCNHILKGAKESITRQNAKIIVFDEKSSGTASPTLKIDENDVIASHGAVVGQLSNEHMFYLMSRGLSKKEARLLITNGYLHPISAYFSEGIQKKILEAIGGINHD